jgi:PAS domain S-box-containing protein
MPHGHCYMWRPSLVWLNAVTDLLIFLSYMVISGSLAFLVFNLKEIPFQRIYILFGTFIFACGLTHAMEVLNIWVPNYWVSVSIKVLTAIASVGTAVVLPFYFPKIRSFVEGFPLFEAQRALKETEKNYQEIATRLKTVLDHAPIILWAVDLNGRYTLAEGKELDIFGLKSGQLVGQSALESKIGRANADVILSRILKGESYHSESQHDEIWLENYVFPLKNPEGRITGAVGISTNVTDRKQNEDATYQSEKSLRKLTEALPQLVWTARPDGVWLYCNLRWVDYTGMNLEQTLTLGWKSVLHPDDYKSFTSFWSMSIRRGEPFEMEYRFKRASDGQFRWHLGRAQPIRDEKGVLTQWFGTCTDIQEQKEAYRRLLESEARTKAVMSNASIILWSVNKDGLITLFEGHGLAQLGLEQGGRIGTSVYEAYKHQPIILDGIKKALQGEETKVEIHIGNYWFEAVYTPIKDPSGNLIGAVGASFDVTARVQADLNLRSIQAQLKQDIAAREEVETALRSSEERFRAAFSQAAVGMCQVGLDGRWILVNERLCEILEYSKDELTSNEFREITHKDDIKKSVEAWTQLGKGHVQSCNFEKRYIRKSQSVVWVNITSSVVKDKLGQLKYFITVVEDISEKVKAREAIVSMNETLEHRVIERTHELVTSQRLLAEKNRELLKSNEELEDFAYIASHDLKEPLRGINNYSTFLIQDYADKLDDLGKDKLLRLKKLTKRLENLIDSLLYYSKVGRSDLAVKETDLNEVLEEVLDSLKPVIESADIQVTVENSLPTLRCDSIRVSEIFLNLISNAIKYNDKIHKIVKISSKIDDDGKCFFSVEDNGIGIKAEHHEIIFKMFRRLHGKEKFGGGTGVGLTVVKKIIERHGGAISVSSTPGEGTTFLFTLDASSVILRK